METAESTLDAGKRSAEEYTYCLGEKHNEMDEKDQYNPEISNAILGMMKGKTRKPDPDYYSESRDPYSQMNICRRAIYPWICIARNRRKKEEKQLPRERKSIQWWWGAAQVRKRWGKKQHRWQRPWEAPSVGVWNRAEKLFAFVSQVQKRMWEPNSTAFPLPAWQVEWSAAHNKRQSSPTGQTYCRTSV